MTMKAGMLHEILNHRLPAFVRELQPWKPPTVGQQLRRVGNTKRS